MTLKNQAYLNFLAIAFVYAEVPELLNLLWRKKIHMESQKMVSTFLPQYNHWNIEV